MKKIIITMIALCALCIMICVSFTGCSGSSGSTAATEAQTAATQAPVSATEAQGAATEANEAAEVTVAPAAEAGDSPLIGSWDYEDGGFTYTFKADGTGVYDIYGEVMNFTYTDNGDSFTMTYEDIDTPTTLDYTIDGDTLTVKDSFGADVRYIKK